MNKKTEQIERYKVSIDLLRYEGEMLWKILSSYMIVNTIILGFITQIAYKDIQNAVLTFYPICFFAGILGLILIVPWLGTFLRNSNYYHFRMLQAKRNEPKKWRLLKHEGEHFAKGEQVEVYNQKIQIGSLGRLMRNKRAIYFIVGIFTLIYMTLIVLFGPWWC
ncbi:hypothetical protein [Tenacibaculum sp. Ill]|uniref:hypothetical protein n=1 Tax=Tenacibaculum sp. Ill TaxID=3445935 RepID=UPI003F7A13D9